MSLKRTLNQLGIALQDEFEADMRDSCCSCHLNPPCNYCIHPGNPNNLEETPEAWDDVEDVKESQAKWLNDSDIIFTAISTSAFESFKEAETAIVMLYVPDITFSRAGISHALKRLEDFYSKNS